MAMLNAIVKGGFYPYPSEQLPAARSLFAPAPQEGGRCVLKAIDPCAGEGAALAYLAANLNLEPYANELDTGRAARCLALFGREQTVQGDLFRLRASGEAFALVWCNPPYGENYGGDDRRIELSALRHSWKWAMVGGYVAWVVYAHHMTRKAAEFLAANADLVDIYRLPGLHLGQYAQILVVARKIERRDPDAELAQRLVEICRIPNSLPELARLDEPRYRFPASPEVRRFVFAPDEITPDVMLAAMQEHGAQQMAGFQQLLVPLPPPAGFHPIVQPRGGHLGLVLAGGLLDGALVETDEGSAAVRGVVRLVTVDTTPEGQHGVRETYQTRPQVTVSLLWKDGRVKTIEAEHALVDFLKTHKTRLLAHLEERSKPVYDFQLDPALTPIFANVFHNRRLPGRPTTGLFAVQKHVVGAVYEALKTRKGVIVVGEMGVGKSAVGAVLAGALHRTMRPGQIAAVMCPPHLVDKWVREIHDAVPDSLAEVVETVDQVTTFMSKAEAKPEQLHVLVMSRERAKLHEGWEPAYLTIHRHQARWSRGVEPPEQYANQPRIVTVDILLCPTCGQTITRSEYGEQRPAPMSWLAQQPRHCPACKGALWQMKRTFSAPAPGELSPKRNPRYALADFLRHRYPGRLGLALIDEIHETKSGASDQGQAMQTLVGAADKAVGLTGTLFGGVASSVFWLEWAFNPRMVEQYPIKDGRATALGRWVEQMGVLEQLIEFKEDNSKAGAYSGKRRVEHRPKEAPGISPYLVKELLDHCVWVGLPDLGFALPDYHEIPVDLDLPPQVQDSYRRARETMSSYLNTCRMEGDASFLGAYLQSLLSYPSACFRQETVVHRQHRQGQVVRENVVTVIPGFGEETIYPKEAWLIETLTQELRAGRRCAVFVRQTGTRDIQTRLKELIDSRVGIAKTVILPGSVEARSRDDRLKGWVQSGVNVLICNPRLVQTGMDLLDFPTLIFFEIDYSLYVTSQASRRAWRIGQTQECRVYYPFYAGTMEEQAIALVSRKQEAAALLSGNVDGGGLAALSGDSGNSLVAELAKVVADDEAVVDLGQLFRRQAEGSADFESGWAQAWATGEKIEVTPPVAQPPDLKETVIATNPVSPLRRQYLEIKKQYPEAILFFHIGTFYETFDADAETVARELDIVLTSRSISKDRRVLAAGIPHHAAQSYINRLIEKGYHVALCEEVGDEPIDGLIPRQVMSVDRLKPASPVTPRPTLEQLRKKYQWHLPSRPGSPQPPLPATSGGQQLPLLGMAAPGGGD